jgi:hypothetical protein
MVKLHLTELSDGGIHLSLHVEIDSIKLRFVLDTGASHSVLDVEWAKENLPKNEINLIDDPAQGIGSSVEVHKAVVSEMKIADLTIKDKMLAMINFDGINSVYEREGIEKVHGILGGDILHEYDAIIDYKEMSIVFQTQGSRF